MIEAIVLDIGGVILRTTDRSGRQALENQFGLPSGGAEDLVFNSKPATESTLGKVSPEQVWLHVAEELNLLPDELAKFKQAFWQGDQVDQKLIQFLKAQKGVYKTALLTNAWLDARKALAEQFNIIEGQTVDHILISSEIGIAKPDPEIYHFLAETLNCQFGQILFVDDFSENIHEADALGIQTIQFSPEMDLIASIYNRLAQN
jgi:glucose-1-phosphatase